MERITGLRANPRKPAITACNPAPLAAGAISMDPSAMITATSATIAMATGPAMRGPSMGSISGGAR